MNHVALPANEAAQAPIAHRFTPDQIELIKRTICKGATDDELKLFMYQAERTGLDPLSRQIYAVKRWDSSQRREVMAMQTSIDGFRLIAERTKKYAGQVGPHWCGDDGQWVDVWLSEAPPAAAKVGIVRTDFTEPCWGVARFASYAATNKEGKLTRMWATMGDVMIAKCAEALGLRKAFPQEMSGIYTGDEMTQAEGGNDPWGALTAEMYQQKTVRELSTWGLENADRISNTPGVKAHFKKRYAEYLAELKAKDDGNGTVKDQLKASKALLDAEDAEVINEKPKKRSATPYKDMADEAFNPDDWLDGLESMLAGCADRKTINEVWDTYAQPTIDRGVVMDPDADKAQAMVDKHLERVEKAGGKD